MARMLDRHMISDKLCEELVEEGALKMQNLSFEKLGQSHIEMFCICPITCHECQLLRLLSLQNGMFYISVQKLLNKVFMMQFFYSLCLSLVQFMR